MIQITIRSDRDGWQRLHDAITFIQDYKANRLTGNPGRKDGYLMVQTHSGYHYKFEMWHTNYEKTAAQTIFCIISSKKSTPLIEEEVELMN